MFGEGLIETRQNSERLANELFDAIKDFPGRLAEPLNAASRQSIETADRLATAVAARLEDTGTILATQVERLRSTAEAVTASLAQVQARLAAMHTPDNIIEVKLQPFISGFTKAVNNQSKATVEQMAELQRFAIGQPRAFRVQYEFCDEGLGRHPIGIEPGEHVPDI